MQNTAQAYALLQAGNLREAKKLLIKINKKNKADPEALMMLGYIHSQLSEHDKSIQCLLKVTHLNPRQEASFYNLGNAYKAKGDLPRAVKAFKDAVKIKPAYGACVNLGNALESLKHYSDAIKYLKLAISINHENADAYYNLGRVLKSAGLLEECVLAYEKAIELKADFTAAYNNLANTYLSIGEIDKAARCYDKALQLEPDSLDVLSGKVRLLDKIKKFDEALLLIEPHVIKQVDHAGLCATFADFSHYVEREDQAIKWLKKSSTSALLTATEKSRLCFLLGKLLDKKKDYKNAFENYEKANVLVKQPVNIAGIRRYFSAIKSTFSESDFNKNSKSTLISSRPIFIVGMPRSGTSLVEQVIASHPDVEGAGELEAVSSLVKDVDGFSNKGLAYPEVMSQLTSEQLDQLAEKYLQRLDKVSTCSVYVTDKMPHNFLHLGFIQMLFPNSRIIHCRRNPVDTSLSCYFQDFSGNHPYSNDLSTLAEYYKLYDDLMGFWSDNLALPMLTIDYEELVSNQENESKKLIEFCQLDWHEGCLRFYENKRVVSTASYDQVRQKVYSKSVARWKNYEPFIQSLISEFVGDE